MTYAELTAVGLPAVYVPLPIGNGEQRRNAAPAIAAGGALMVADDELDTAWIHAHVIPLLGDRARLAAMATASQGLGRPDADKALMELVLDAAGASR